MALSGSLKARTQRESEVTKSIAALISDASERRRIADVANAERMRAREQKQSDAEAALAAFVAEQREIHEEIFLGSAESASCFAMRLRETRDFLAHTSRPTHSGMPVLHINKTISNWIGYIQLQWSLYGDAARFSANYEFNVAKALYVMSPALEAWALTKIRN